MFDDDEPRRKPATELGQSLATHSVDELEAYVRALKAEIVRVQAEIAKRSDVRSAAEALFRKPGG
ncbi:MAG: DUF1192 domain-containing protein [Geminicoccaceae bacterium]|nr:DUF1192 domain-containing protein [Geminicoccaceae bacterium]